MNAKEKKKRFNANKSEELLTTTDTTEKDKRYNAKSTKVAKKNREKPNVIQVKRYAAGRAALNVKTLPGAWSVRGTWQITCTL